MKLIKITADDFGATQGVNDAIISLHKNGVVNYAAMMVMGDASNNAIAESKNNPNLNVGLHFVLTDETSITFGKSLINKKGYFYKRNKLLFNCIFNRIAKDEISAELLAQYDYLIDRGIKPTFINGHQHIHVLPIICDIVSTFAKSKNLLVSIPNYNLPNRVYNIKNLSSAYLSRQLKSRLDSRGVEYNNNFISNFSDAKRDFSLKGFEKCLQLAQSTGSLGSYDYMVHPAQSSDGLGKYWLNSDSLVSDRIQEFKSLSGPAFVAFCKKYNFKIV